jgi:hypothetical protein
MSSEFSDEQRQAFHRAREALEQLLAIQRKVKDCADALKAAHDPKRYEEVAKEYVILLDDWDKASARYAEVNHVLLKYLYSE